MSVIVKKHNKDRDAVHNLELVKMHQNEGFPKLVAVVFLGTLLFATANVARPSESGKNVTLEILDASALRKSSIHVTQLGNIATNYLDFVCVAVIDNPTGKTIFVKSKFFSAFDWVSLHVMSTKGENIMRQSFDRHQSPFGTERVFLLHSGRTTNLMRFPISGVPVATGTVKVCLEGELPGSYLSLTSNVVNVQIKNDDGLIR